MNGDIPETQRKKGSELKKEKNNLNIKEVTWTKRKEVT